MSESYIPNSKVPKVIWIYWAQGTQTLPFLVERCVSSWKALNPGWQVNVVDNQSLSEVVDLGGVEQREDIILQHLSDIIRVRLLQQQGGVWADASLLCNRPLDEWLTDAISDNFFCFASARRDRLMTTWFLAGQHSSQLLQAWSGSIDNYWQENSFRHQSYWSRQVIRKLMSLRKRNIVSNDIWFSKLVQKKMRIYPYPINMYLFEKAIDGDAALTKKWEETQSYVDQPAEHLQNHFGINELLNQESKVYLENKDIPVHKLNWRQDMGEAKVGTNFRFLLDKLGL